MTETEILARTLYGEAKANDVEDATAIACVILNRVNYRNWPGEVADVCLQPLQFSVWNESDAGRPRMLRAQRGDAWFDRCWTIAEQALTGALVDKTRTSTHYHTRAVKPRWSRGKTPCYETQGHLYFNNIDTPAPANAAEALAMERPLATTRTVVGAAVAGTATVVGAAAGIASPHELPVTAQDVQAITQVASAFGLTALSTLLPHVVALAGVAYSVWARIDDRRKGLR